MSTQFHEESINTGSQQFDIVVGSYGDAKGTKEQFEKTDPSCLDGTISELGNTKSFADHIASRIESFRQRLNAAWQGETANDALDILSALHSDATTISSSASQCASALSHFQKQWVSARSQAMNLYEGVLGTGLHEDNSGAHTIFRQFCQSMSDGMHEMPGTLSYHTGMAPHEVYGGQPPGGGGGGGGGGLPAMGGGGGVPAGVGQYGTPGSPGNLDPGKYPHPGAGPGGYGDPGSGVGDPGSGFGGPGGVTGPGDPGSFGGGSPTTTWPPTGGDPSYGGGTTTLSGYGGYPGGVGAAGGGAGGGFGAAGLGAGGVGVGGLGAGGVGAGGGIGAAAGVPGAGLTGAGAGLMPTATVAAVAPGEGGAGGTRAGMMPMRGGSGGDDDERDRSTWLDEDDDVWGAAEGLPPVLS